MQMTGSRRRHSDHWQRHSLRHGQPSLSGISAWKASGYIPSRSIGTVLGLDGVVDNQAREKIFAGRNIESNKLVDLGFLLGVIDAERGLDARIGSSGFTRKL